ncbi:hypothetical protein BH160DRAFT_7161 [Burkholderia sp. H160]|nr:hypothetical protein BH160DRAFT_7161 [Burkholderia sp. H160]
MPKRRGASREAHGIWKIILRLSLVAAAFATFASLSLAQSTNEGALRRQQVRQEVIDLAAVGYYPIDFANYPQSVLVAKQRLAAKRGAQEPATSKQQ